jgi:hypothetical protein
MFRWEKNLLNSGEIAANRACCVSERMAHVCVSKDGNQPPTTRSQTMNANNDERMSGAVDQEAFEKVIRDNLSPEAVATIIAFLQPAAFYRPANEEAMQALLQVEWLANTLTDMLGVEEHNRLMEELGL